MGSLQENTTIDSGLIEEESFIDFNSIVLGHPPEGFEISDVIPYQDVQDQDLEIILLRSVYDDFNSPIGDYTPFEFHSQSDQLFIEEEKTINSVLKFDYTFNDFETKTYPKINWIKQQPATDGWVKLQEVT